MIKIHKNRARKQLLECNLSNGCIMDLWAGLKHFKITRGVCSYTGTGVDTVCPHCMSVYLACLSSCLSVGLFYSLACLVVLLVGLSYHLISLFVCIYFPTCLTVCLACHALLPHCLSFCLLVCLMVLHICLTSVSVHMSCLFYNPYLSFLSLWLTLHYRSAYP